jgi:8-amino-7-oxononanoate synthase
VILGTLGKSFGAAGAFVAGSSAMVRWIWNRARSFVFSTGLSPVLAAAALEVLPTLRAGQRSERLHHLAGRFRRALGAHTGRSFEASSGPIVPVLLGSADAAVACARALRDQGILAQPIRPPTVPRETSRLRLAVQAGHDEAELIDAARTIGEVLR